MKKFNETLNEKVDHYAGNEIIKNKIWDIIEENLVAKMDGEISDKISLIGKEKLVEELEKIVQNEINKSKISLLETYKSNPIIVNENVADFIINNEQFKKVKDKISEDYKKIAQTIKSLGEEHPLRTIKNKVDNSIEEYEEAERKGEVWIRRNMKYSEEVSIEKQKETIEKMIDNFENKWKNEAANWDMRRNSLIWNDVVERVKELKELLKNK